MNKHINQAKQAARAAAAAFVKLLIGAAKLLLAVAEDILILAGLGMIVYATFRWSETAGWYAAGICAFGLGVWLAGHPIRRKKR
jgi:hypothetical protein